LYHSRRAGRIPEFDNVVIETSGLAEPGPVLQAFLSEPTLDGLYRVAQVVALVDAVNAASTLSEHDEAVQQVALADRILITKLDLLDDPKRADALREQLQRINPAATILDMRDVLPDIGNFFRTPGFDPVDPNADPRPWLKLESYDHDHHHDHDHEHHHHWGERQIESFCLIRDEPLGRDALQLLLDGITQNLGPSLLRVKGLVNVADEPGRPAVIQGVQHLLHTVTWLDKWPDADHRTRVVFITRGVARQALQEVVELLERVASRTSKARRRATQGTDDSIPKTTTP
jgi:G3E family GTPase